MKALIIESTVFGYDGITNVIMNYYKYQDHEEVHMDLVTINSIDNGFKEELSKYGSKNFVLPYRNTNPAKYLYKLIKIIKGGKYQLVHVHGCSATMAVEMFAAKAAGVKIRIAHSHNTKCDHVKADKLLRPLFYRTCNVGFACGKEAGEWLFQNRKFTLVSNGVDIDKFQYNELIRNEIRTQYELTDKLVIGHIGRFNRQKNHERLIAIFEKISKEYENAKLVLIGEGELRSEIEKKVTELNLDVLFVGVSQDVDKWLQAMDIIVFPSIYEGLPLVLVEAQAAGLPCVLSNTISPATKITDLVEFVNLDASLDTWLMSIKKSYNGFDRKKRIENVKKQIQNNNFDIKENCIELANIYEKLIECEGKM